MEKIIFGSEFFNIKDTLECGQIFRFRPYKKGYLVFSGDKVAYAYNDGEKAVVFTDHAEYFYDFFDLKRDYAEIFSAAKNEGLEVLSVAANEGKGIRILNQNRFESALSFIVSQNNNIPRIKGIIERLCAGSGEKKVFVLKDENGKDERIEYYAFPEPEALAKKNLDFFVKAGLGYRAAYVKRFAEKIADGFSLEELSKLSTPNLKKELLSVYGIGEKVADCISLFGFHRSDSFPVDTWIEKVYRENMNGKEKNRAKITEELTARFKDNAGYYQQYLFYYKRSIENR